MGYNRKIKVMVVAGARPNFMKCAPLIKELTAAGSFEIVFVHTGQHYDYDMSRVFFKHLRLKRPDIFLNVGSAARMVQIERVRRRFERAIRRFMPDMVIVVGDVNSTLGAGLAAKRLGVKLAHVESGLRSFDRSMPEEANRILTDSISDLLFTTSRSADTNLAKEGIPKEKIYFVGNVMIDTLAANLKMAGRSDILRRLGLQRRRYYLLTLHRPSNVDKKRVIAGILAAITKIANGDRVVFPIHPRTRKTLEKFDLFAGVKQRRNLMTTRPLGYLDFLKLLKECCLVFTDSGGIQEEAAYLKVPCLTLRKNTERPITVEAGWNLIAGNAQETISKAFESMSNLKRRRRPKAIEFWDGKAARRIVDILLEKGKEWIT